MTKQLAYIVISIIISLFIGKLYLLSPFDLVSGPSHAWDIGNIVYEGSEMKEIYIGIDDFSDAYFLQVFSQVFGSCRFLGYLWLWVEAGLLQQGFCTFWGENARHSKQQENGIKQLEMLMFRGVPFQERWIPWSLFCKQSCVWYICGLLFNECCCYFVVGMQIVRRTCLALLLLCCIQGLWIPRLASHSCHLLSKFLRFDFFCWC